jgi:hypothetical protein
VENWRNGKEAGRLAAGLRSWGGARLGRSGGDFGGQLADVVAGGEEGGIEFLHCLWAVGSGGLFDEAMKQLADESMAGAGRGGGVRGYIAGSPQSDGFAFGREVR